MKNYTLEELKVLNKEFEEDVVVFAYDVLRTEDFLVWLENKDEENYQYSIVHKNNL